MAGITVKDLPNMTDADLTKIIIKLKAMGPNVDLDTLILLKKAEETLQARGTFQ